MVSEQGPTTNLDSETPQGYPYTNYNGFGLNFAGGDLLLTGEKFALRLDLRFGPGASLLSPIAPIKQAYASWMPAEKLNIDVGFFDTIYGAEVVDEWANANYTRGALYFLRQPFNHMGLRMGIEMNSIAGFTAMVTNGGVYGGTPIDDNETPALGWQFGLSPDGHNSVGEGVFAKATERWVSSSVETMLQAGTTTTRTGITSSTRGQTAGAGLVPPARERRLLAESAGRRGHGLRTTATAWR